MHSHNESEYLNVTSPVQSDDDRNMTHDDSAAIHADMKDVVTAAIENVNHEVNKTAPMDIIDYTTYYVRLY